MSYAFLRTGTLIGLLGLAAAAHAMSLGELNVQSRLGEPFVGTVRYTAARGDDVAPMCIRARNIGTGAAPSGVPDLPDPRIDVQPAAGGGTIVVRTVRPVEEPLMRLSLAVNCGPSAIFNREFMVALDPPRGDSPVLRGAYGAPERPQAGAAAPAAGAPATTDSQAGAPTMRRGAAGAGSSAINPPAAVAVEPRSRRPRAPAASAAPGGRLATELPYEPGVTPPPGRRGARPPAEEPRQKFRLTLSRPGSDAANPVPLLRGSDSLASLSVPAIAAVTPQQRDRLRAEWRARMVDDPLAENQKMQDDVGRLGGAVNDLKAQIAAIQKERDAARAEDAKRIAQLEEDKRNLAAWLNGLAGALGFIGCVAVAALLFWNWRRRGERQAARARRVTVDLTPPAEAERVEPIGLEDESGVTAWRADEEPAATPATSEPEASQPAKRPMGRPVPAGPRVATPRPTPPGVSAPPPGVAAPTPPAAPPVPRVPEDPTITKTVELSPKPGTVPPVEDFYANPPRGADEPEFSLDEPPQPPVMPPPAPPQAMAIDELEAAGAEDLPPITFELSPGEMASPPALPSAQPGTHGVPIEFSIGAAAAEMKPAAPAAADPFGDVPEPPPSPAHNATLVQAADGAGPTPTVMRMKALVDELAAAHLGEPAAAPPPQEVPTGAHRTLDIDLGGDGDSEMRAQLYRQEFELKLFPEIVHGQAKLKVPQSIISLARTYYQEDFDTNRAINLLEYAADRTPDPQRVRLALLEILRMEGMAREYVAVARGFSTQFPGADEWETVAAYGKLLAPGEPLFEDADATGYDLNMPSMWLGSTLDMTRYVLAQDLHDAMHGPGGVGEEA